MSLIYSVKVIAEALKTDLSAFTHKAESKPYEFNVTLKITDMNQFINDLKNLLRNNWKIILWIVLAIFFISNYEEIKSGILDGWNAK